MASTENVYFAKIQFGKIENGVERIDLIYEYPSLPYGHMVGIQALLAATAIPALVEVGVTEAHSIGQDVPGVDASPADSRTPPGQAKK